MTTAYFTLRFACSFQNFGNWKAARRGPKPRSTPSPQRAVEQPGANETPRARPFPNRARGGVFNVLAMGLNPSPSGETFRFFVLLEHGDGEVPNEFAQPL